jgi:hypothetical protein
VFTNCLNYKEIMENKIQINGVWYVSLDVRGNVLLDLIDYWREVKQEIQKL